MPKVFARPGGRLYFRLKCLDGKWRNEPCDAYRVGQESEAQRYAVQAQRDVDRKRGTLTPDAPPTVAEYAEKWLEERRANGLRSVGDDTGRINNHVLPSLGMLLLDLVRPVHIRDFVRRLRRQCTIAPRTILNVYGLTHTMFRDAQIEGLIVANPCILKRGELPPKVDKDPEWRSLATYETSEVRALVSDMRLPVERRVQYALKALGALRHGEVASLRWRHWNETIEPLGQLVIARSYNSAVDETGRTKTEVTRPMPVHQTLARLLTAWRTTHWQRIYGREPAIDDLIVPTRTFRPVDAADANHAFKDDLLALGFRIDAGGHRDRGGHDLRAWFISTAQECGASRELLAIATHTKKRDVVSGYSRHRWAVICAEVAKLDFALSDEEILPVCSAFAPREAMAAKRWRSEKNRTENERPRRDSKTNLAAGDTAQESVTVEDDTMSVTRSELERLRHEADLLRQLAAAVLAGDEVGARRLAGQVKESTTGDRAARKPA